MNNEPEVTEEIEVTEEVPPPNFYRKHTFAAKGPSQREYRAYRRSLEIFLPISAGKKGNLNSDQISNWFSQQRAALFPEQHVANLAVLQKKLDKAARKARKA